MDSPCVDELGLCHPLAPNGECPEGIAMPCAPGCHGCSIDEPCFVANAGGGGQCVAPDLSSNTCPPDSARCVPNCHRCPSFQPCMNPLTGECAEISPEFLGCPPEYTSCAPAAPECLPLELSVEKCRERYAAWPWVCDYAPDDSFPAELNGALDDARRAAENRMEACPAGWTYDVRRTTADGTPDPGCIPVCNDDPDEDDVLDPTDNCPFHPNPGQADTDGDGRGDVCDPCPGDDRDDDSDLDGVCDVALIPEDNDNCPLTYNPLQEDLDEDTHGDACDNCVAVPNADQSE